MRHVVLYRTVLDYGVAPWTLGAHLNSEEHGGRETGRILNSFYGGLIVLVLAVAISVFASPRVTDRSRTLPPPAR